MKRALSKRLGLLLAAIMLLACCAVLLGNAKPLNVSAEEDKYAAISRWYTSNEALKDAETQTLLAGELKNFAEEVENAKAEEEVSNINQVVPQVILDELPVGESYRYFGEEYGFVVIKQRKNGPPNFGVIYDSLVYIHLTVIDYDLREYDEETKNKYRDAEEAIALRDEMANEYIARIKIVIDNDFRYGQSEDGSGYTWIKTEFDLPVEIIIQNVQIAQSLLNENALNYGDPGYDKQTDYGPIIQQTRVNYRKIEYYTERGELKALLGSAKLTGETVLAISSEYIDKVAKFNLIYSLIKTGYEAVCLVNDYIASYDVKERVTEMNNEANIFTNNSREKQRIDSDYDTYTRLSHMKPDSKYVLSNGAYYENIIMLNDTNARSRLSQIIQFNLAVRDCYGNIDPLEKVEEEQYKPIVVYGEHKLFPEINPIQLDKETDLYLLPGGDQSYEFTAPYTGMYRLNFDTDKEFRCALHDVSKPEGEYEEASPLGENYIFMEAQKTYRIKLSLVQQTERFIGKVRLSFVPQDVAEGSNAVINDEGVRYISFQSELFRHYNFICSDENARLTPVDKFLLPCGETAVGSYTQYISVDDEIYLCIESDLPQLELAIKNYKKVIFANNDFDEIILEEGETLDELPEYSVPGGIFQGWKTQAGEAITAAQVVAADEPNVTLYPDITWIEYNIVYIENGGTEIPDGVYTARDVVPLNNHITREGYLFLGWCENADFSDEPFKYIGAGNVGDKVFYACWAKEIITATLDVNASDTDGVSASVASSAVEIAYNSLVDLPVPEIEGFDFDGWFCGDKQYTLSDGVMITSFVEKDDLTLTAHWTRQSYKIKINFGEDGAPSFKWLAGENILADEETEIEYVSGLCPNCWMLEKMPLSAYYKAGHIYQKLVTADGRIACWDTFRPNLQDGAEFELTAVYGKESYTIVFYEFAETDIPSITAEYGEELIMPEGRGEEGRDFDCWIVADYDKNNAFKAPFAKGAVFQYGYMPDLTVNEQGDAIIYLARKFNPKTYTITFVDGANRWEMQVRYGEPVPAAPIPSRVGHSFSAWYSDEGTLFDYKGQFLKEEGLWLIAHDVQAEPYYHPNTYTIYYYDPEYTKTNTHAYVVYGQQITLKTIERTHYDGYWKINGKLYTMGSTFKYDIAAGMTFSAVWQGKYYDIVYHNLYDSAQGQTANPGMATTYQYGVGLDFSGKKAFFFYPYTTIHELEFIGYYKEASLTNVMTRIRSTQSGTVHVYVRWRRIVGNPHRLSEVEVSGFSFDGHKDMVRVGLKSNYNFQEQKAFGFKYVAITIELLVWEKDDGMQRVHIYDGPGSDAKLLRTWEFYHNKGVTDTNRSKHSTTFFIPIDELADKNVVYLRYQSDTMLWWGKPWYNKDLNVGVQYLCETSDLKPMKDGSIYYTV